MKRYTREEIKELTGEDIDSEYGYLDVLSETQNKSKQQNKLFHSLLDCFWDSGCSSFESKQDMRWHYKNIATLISVDYISTLDEWTKECLWKSIKILPLSSEQRNSVIDLLKGKVLKEHSWGSASKYQAKLAIDEIIRDMDTSGVITSKKGYKYQEILRGIGELWE